MLHDAYVDYEYSSVCKLCGVLQTMGGYQLSSHLVEKPILSALVLQGRISEAEIFPNDCYNCPSEESLGHETYELITTSTT